MIKTENSIFIDFKKSGYQAEQLEEVSKELERLSDFDMPEHLKKITEHWQGEHVALYEKNGQNIIQTMKETAEKLRISSITIQKIAKAVYETEKKALQTMAECTYGK